MSGGEPLRTTVCDTEPTLAAAAVLFDDYRRHYAQPPAADGRTVAWLTETVRSGMLVVLTASAGPDDAPPIGLATGHPVPASLAMGRFWQLRDLYVRPDARRLGAAAALVGAVRDAATTAGATRLSLVTEPDNEPALALYAGLGFRPVEDLVTLSLDLPRPGAGD